jgi:hypothetical protein
MEVVISSFDAEGAVVCSEEKGEKSGNYGMNGSNHHTGQFHAWGCGTYRSVAWFREIRSILAKNMTTA